MCKSTIVVDEGLGAVSWGLWVDRWLRKSGCLGTAPSHKHNAQRVQSSTKHQNSSCGIVMQYTCWHDWKNNVKFVVENSCSVWQWIGLMGPGQVDEFSPLLDVALQRRWHGFQPLCLAWREGAKDTALSQSPWLQDGLSSARAVFDQTSYVGVTSHFTK